MGNQLHVFEDGLFTFPNKINGNETNLLNENNFIRCSDSLSNVNLIFQNRLLFIDDEMISLGPPLKSPFLE